jgi:GNAT superfamily N-acetyltransferase/predicted CoA-binding protein
MSTEALSTGHRTLLADGTVVLVRRLGPADRDAVLQLHAELPPDDRYLRFFSAGTAQLDQLADLVVSDSAVAVGAFRSGELVGVAHYRREPAGTPPEVAVVVRHDQQHRGVATLLFEYLFAVARSEGVTQVDADVLAVNQGVSVVLRDLGLPVRSTCFADVREVVVRVPETGTTTASERYVQAMLERSIQSDVTSLRPVLAPRSVVVIGAGSRPESVGRLVLRQLVEGGFTGPVHLVTRHTTDFAHVRTHPRIEDLDEGIDLAVICVPAAAVPDVARRCGERGIRGLLVITSGVSTDPLLRDELQAALSRYGMRRRPARLLVGAPWVARRPISSTTVPTASCPRPGRPRPGPRAPPLGAAPARPPRGRRAAGPGARRRGAAVVARRPVPRGRRGRDQPARRDRGQRGRHRRADPDRPPRGDRPDGA